VEEAPAGARRLPFYVFVDARYEKKVRVHGRVENQGVLRLGGKGRPAAGDPGVEVAEAKSELPTKICFAP
jgi:hypothetical protein